MLEVKLASDAVEVFVDETSHDADVKQDVLVSLLRLLEIFECLPVSVLTAIQYALR